MKKADYIFDLAKGKMSLNGYEYFVSLVKFYTYKFNWPKTILEENVSTDTFWTDEEVISLTHQLLLFILEKGKLKHYQKIPESYIEYYFKTIIVSYVANRIRELQNKTGLSFDDTKRVSLEILNELYFSKEINNDVFWNKVNVFCNPVEENETINEIVRTLPKIPITEKTRHYKPRVKTALNDIFNLINRPLKQSVIFNQVFNLFDQSSFSITFDDETTGEIREDLINRVVQQIIANIDRKIIPIYLDYYFSKTQNSLNSIALKYNLPKSTVHQKVTRFTKIISNSFMPENEQEGVWFLEKLHSTRI